ncbi:hypothetical protein GVAV_001081 [Gurleya vavrai]
MERFCSLQILNGLKYKITTINVSKIIEYDEIFTNIENVDSLTLITPFHYNPETLSNELFNNSNLKKMKHIFNSAAASFALETQSICYINITKIHYKDDSYFCNIEVIDNMKILKTECKIFLDNLENILNEIFNILNELSESVLSNLFIDVDDDNFKQFLEEKIKKLAMKNLKSNKIFTFLHLNNYIKNNNLFCDAIKNDCTSIGGIMSGKILFQEERDFMTRMDHIKEDFKKLMLHLY